MQDERAVAADAGDDRLAGFRMLADVARQRQQRQRLLEIDASPASQPLGRLARLAFLASLAELHVGAEAAGAQRDLGRVSGSLPSTLCRRRRRSPLPFSPDRPSWRV